MNDSTPNHSEGRMPSDEQMDGLLREFFRLEMPTELNQPFRHGSNAVSAGPVHTPAGLPTERSELTTRVRRNRQLVAVSALAVLALSLAVIVQLQDNEIPSVAPVSPVAGTNDQPLPSAAPQEELMLASPQGDSNAANLAVGENGVTLEETDNIELKPRQ